MIARITGLLERVGEGEVMIAVGGLGYQVMVPERTCRNLASRVGEEIDLHTVYYLQGFGVGHVQPILLGFECEEDRAFFQLLTTVDGLGSRAAMRLLVEPVTAIARAIEQGDAEFLRKLPGVGRQRAGEIIAKLRGKVADFALGADGSVASEPEPGPALDEGVRTEVFGILQQLGYSEREAERMLRDAAGRSEAADAETLIRDIFARFGREASP